MLFLSLTHSKCDLRATHTQWQIFDFIFKNISSIKALSATKNIMTFFFLYETMRENKFALILGAMMIMERNPLSTRLN